MLTKLEKRILYNFVVAENNRLIYPEIDTFNLSTDIEIKIKPCFTNLNNFNGDTKKYSKCLKRLIKKLNLC